MDDLQGLPSDCPASRRLQLAGDHTQTRNEAQVCIAVHMSHVTITTSWHDIGSMPIDARQAARA